jgi:hypothetical protein
VSESETQRLRRENVVQYKRIAELEAELAALKVENKWHLAELNKWHQNADELADGLAALKGRMCMCCDNGDTTFGDEGPLNTYCGLHSSWRDHDDCCNRWAARAEEGGES